MTTEADPGLWKWAAGLLAGAWLGINTFMHKRQLQRIDDINDRERTYVTRDELKGQLDRIESGIKDVHQRIDSHLTKER